MSEYRGPAETPAHFLWALGGQILAVERERPGRQIVRRLGHPAVHEGEQAARGLTQAAIVEDEGPVGGQHSLADQGLVAHIAGADAVLGGGVTALGDPRLHPQDRMVGVADVR